jgi:hypothetical protein
MEYTLIYKCRRCGEIINIIDTHESIEDDNDVALVIKENPELMVHRHECTMFTETSFYGITDLVGFSLLKEEVNE